MARVPTFTGSVGAFVAPGAANADKPYITIFNKTGSGVLVAVRSLVMQIDHTSNSSSVRDWKTTRITTAPTDGTLLTPQTWDTTKTHNTNVEIRSVASADGTNVAFTAAPGTDRADGSFNVRNVTAVGELVYPSIDMLPEYPYPDDPLILRENEGVVVSMVAAGSSLNSFLFDAAIEEFTYYVTSVGPFAGSIAGLTIQNNVVVNGRSYRLTDGLPGSVVIDHNLSRPGAKRAEYGDHLAYVEGRGNADSLAEFRSWTGFDRQGLIGYPRNRGRGSTRLPPARGLGGLWIEGSVVLEWPCVGATPGLGRFEHVPDDRTGVIGQ